VTRRHGVRLPPFPEPARAMPASPRVSIVITNHDYAVFLPDAIDSALAQDGAEVIVVDDGSEDDSREVIAGYGAAITPLLQPNAGQKAAFNAGFAVATGDVVLFLDSDDVLRPRIVAAVAAAFGSAPATARVVYRVEHVDAAGRSLGTTMPRAGVRLPQGDVRETALNAPDDLAWPPTSGNAFARAALARVMPLPVDEDLIGADFWLHTLTPLLGSVTALPCIGASYRVHHANAHHRARADAAQSRYLVGLAQRTHVAQRRLADDLGFPPLAAPRSVTLAVHRFVSLRTGRAQHPVAGDTRRRALRAGLAAVGARRDATLARRVAYAAWLLALTVAPRRAVAPLAQAFFDPPRRPGLRAIGSARTDTPGVGARD
jgi:glycosyltransferase involved in cell wall biosynthesis